MTQQHLIEYYLPKHQKQKKNMESWEYIVLGK